MGDRVWVGVTIRKTDYEKTVKAHEEELGVDDTSDEGSTITLQQNECNYANWEELEKFLTDNRIEYNKRWEQGGDYDAGCEYARLVNGKMTVMGITKAQEALVDFLKEIHGKTPEEIMEAAKKEYEKLIPFPITPLNEPTSIKLIKDLATEAADRPTSKPKVKKNK